MSDPVNHPMTCHHDRVEVIDVRGLRGLRRRRYRCIDCDYRYSTLEMPVPLTSKLTAEDQFVMMHLGIDYEQLKAINVLVGAMKDEQ